MKNVDTAELESLIRALTERGYEVKKKAEYIRKTVEIAEDQLRTVDAFRSTMQLSFKETVEQALNLWIAAKSKELSKRAGGPEDKQADGR